MTKEAACAVEKEEDAPSAGTKLKKERKMPREDYEPVPLLDAACTYISYFVVFIFGHLADFCRKIGLKKEGGMPPPINVHIKLNLQFNPSLSLSLSLSLSQGWLGGFRSPLSAICSTPLCVCVRVCVHARPITFYFLPPYSLHILCGLSGHVQNEPRL